MSIVIVFTEERDVAARIRFYADKLQFVSPSFYECQGHNMISLEVEPEGDFLLGADEDDPTSSPDDFFVFFRDGETLWRASSGPQGDMLCPVR